MPVLPEADHQDLLEQVALLELSLPELPLPELPPLGQQLLPAEQPPQQEPQPPQPQLQDSQPHSFHLQTAVLNRQPSCTPSHRYQRHTEQWPWFELP